MAPPHPHPHPCCCSLQGILAPVLASCSLFGLYLIIKYLPDFSIQVVSDFDERCDVM